MESNCKKSSIKRLAIKEVRSGTKGSLKYAANFWENLTYENEEWLLEMF